MTKSGTLSSSIPPKAARTGHMINWTVVLMLPLGFSSGLPLLVTLDLMKAWLTDAGVTLTLVGASSLLTLPYTLKFLWAPFFDHVKPPILGRRRGWMLVTQVATAGAILAFGQCDAVNTPLLFLVSAFMVSFSSASQDIVLDAYRRDALEDRLLPLASSVFVAGYRLGMVVSGAVALWLADKMFSWPGVFTFVSCCMLIGVAATLAAHETEGVSQAPSTIKEAILLPIRDFMQRTGALNLLLFILLYKLGDMLASAMTIPFYLHVGFSKADIGLVGKTFGLSAQILGTFVGSTIIMKNGFYRSLWLFGILQALGILAYPSLLYTGPVVAALAAVVVVENLSIGLATAAYVGTMSALCSRSFSASQYALLSSLSGVPRTILSSSTGSLAELLGWKTFFIMCAILAIPGLLILSRLRKVLPG
jgi:PAT family beta-lactamase induction signal transducer AmpG